MKTNIIEAILIVVAFHEEAIPINANIIAAGVSTANIHSINEPYKFVFTLEIFFLQKGLKHTTAP